MNFNEHVYINESNETIVKNIVNNRRAFCMRMRESAERQ